MSEQVEARFSPVVQDYYDRGVEHGRLLAGAGRLELERIRELLRRFLPPEPATVLDVGGGAGIHAEWLAADGHRVHLVDPVESHVDRAARLPGVRASVGDARALPAADGSCEVVLMLGPLYHLTGRAERLLAWREARRVVRPGGLVAAATISRFAPMHDGLVSGFVDDERFRELATRDLVDGQHRPPAGERWFTEAYLHYPTESLDEAAEAGLNSAELYAVEGTAWMLPGAQLDAWFADPARWARLLWTLRQVEREPTVIGASSHLLTVARRPQVAQ